MKKSVMYVAGGVVALAMAGYLVLSRTTVEAPTVAPVPVVAVATPTKTAVPVPAPVVTPTPVTK